MSDLEELLTKIKQFRDERDWMQFHNHKDMAISLVLEANEVLEHFQWKNQEQIDKHVEEHREDIAEEIADVAIFLLELADNLKIDVKQAVLDKLKKNTAKYPIDKARGTYKKYNQL